MHYWILLLISLNVSHSTLQHIDIKWDCWTLGTRWSFHSSCMSALISPAHPSLLVVFTVTVCSPCRVVVLEAFITLPITVSLPLTIVCASYLWCSLLTVTSCHVGHSEHTDVGVRGAFIAPPVTLGGVALYQM